jgi:hypothetical protein
VRERPIAVEQPYGVVAGEYAPDPDLADVIWLRLPADLALNFDLGFCHTDVACPYLVLVTRDDDEPTQPVYVWGPPESFLTLAREIAKLCKTVPCLTHDARGEAAHPERVGVA